jgi:hypothetical protein
VSVIGGYGVGLGGMCGGDDDATATSWTYGDSQIGERGHERLRTFEIVIQHREKIFHFRINHLHRRRYSVVHLETRTGTSTRASWPLNLCIARWRVGSASWPGIRDMSKTKRNTYAKGDSWPSTIVYLRLGDTALVTGGGGGTSAGAAATSRASRDISAFVAVRCSMKVGDGSDDMPGGPGAAARRPMRRVRQSVRTGTRRSRRETFSCGYRTRRLLELVSRRASIISLRHTEGIEWFFFPLSFYAKDSVRLGRGECCGVVFHDVFEVM